MRCFLIPAFLLLALSLHGLTFGPGYSIVIPENPTPQEKYSAEELGKYLGKVIGKEFPLMSESEYSEDKALYVGATKRAAAAELTKFESEEFRIRTDKNDLIIVGSQIRGVLFGSYEFLERFAGVRFFSYECERIPAATAIEVPDQTDLRYKPTCIYRFIWAGNRKGLSNHFYRKVRLTGWGGGMELGSSERFGTDGHCHSYHHYSKDFPQEISWMARGGKRFVVTNATMGSICFSHPEVLKRFTTRLKENIAADRANAANEGLPPPRFYSVSQNDCDAACGCPQCKAFIDKQGVSGLVIHFTNQLWDSIKDDYPDVYLVMFAYFDSLQPPTEGVRPRRNVLVQLTTYTKPFHDHLRAISDPVNVGYQQLITGWKQLSEKLAIWDYWRYYDGFLPPATNVKNLPEMMRTYRDCGVLLNFTEYEITPKQLQSFFDLTFYTGCRLLYNPDCDPEILIREFMETYYGAAAPEMRKYLELIISGVKQNKTVREESVNFRQRQYLNDPEFYRQGFALLGEAEKAVTGDALLTARVHQEKILLESTYIKVWENHKNPLKLDKKQLQDSVVKMLPEVAKTFFDPHIWTDKIASEMEIFYADKVHFSEPQNISARPLDSFDPTQLNAKIFGIQELHVINKTVDDVDAPEGKAFSHSYNLDSSESSKFHDRPFTFGLFESDYRVFVANGSIEQTVVPQDEKYHWYYAGKTALYPRLSLWLHWSWRLNAGLGKYYDTNSPNQEYEIFFLLKMQGPAYVKDSKQKNDVLLAKIALVKAPEINKE